MSISAALNRLPKTLSFFKNIPRFESKMFFMPCIITPDTARLIEKRFHPRQRKSKESRLMIYSGDMDMDAWLETHECIAFDVDGWCVDGKTRIGSIIHSGASVKLWVAFNLPRNALVTIDQGLTRSAVDAAHISNIKLGDLEMRSDFVACGRAMYAGYKGAHHSKKRLTIQSLLNFCKDHEKAILFSVTECTPKNMVAITQSGVRAVLARAFYGPKNSHARIRDFAEMLYTGMPKNPRKDIAAISLRNWLQGEFQAGRRRRVNARPNQVMVYGRVQAALQTFLEQKIQKEKYTLRPNTSSEIFLLPEEKK